MRRATDFESIEVTYNYLKGREETRKMEKDWVKMRDIRIV